MRFVAVFLDRANHVCLQWARENFVKPQERWVVREMFPDGVYQVPLGWESATFSSWSQALEAISWLEQEHNGKRFSYEHYRASRR